MNGRGAVSRSTRLAAAAIGLAITGAPAAYAADGAQACRNGSFSETEFDTLGLARVAVAGRVHFRLDGVPGCPGDGPGCLDKPYLVQGDTVLTGRTRAGYVCALFPNKAGGSAGWLRSSELTAVPQPLPSLAAWTGRWRDGDDEIRLSVRGDALVAKGEAYWPSANPSLKDRPGGPNIGEMSGTARPQGRAVVFGKCDDCVLRLALIGDYLLASDNSQCGGMNVRFDGVYTRRR